MYYEAPFLKPLIGYFAAVGVLYYVIFAGMGVPLEQSLETVKQIHINAPESAGDSAESPVGDVTN